MKALIATLFSFKKMVLINGHLENKNNAIYSVFYKLISTTDLSILDFIGVQIKKVPDQLIVCGIGDL